MHVCLLSFLLLSLQLYIPSVYDVFPPQSHFFLLIHLFVCLFFKEISVSSLFPPFFFFMACSLILLCCCPRCPSLSVHLLISTHLSPVWILAFRPLIELASLEYFMEKNNRESHHCFLYPVFRHRRQCQSVWVRERAFTMEGGANKKKCKDFSVS